MTESVRYNEIEGEINASWFPGKNVKNKRNYAIRKCVSQCSVQLLVLLAGLFTHCILSWSDKKRKK